VFFYQNAYGSRVFCDALGKPWPKHAVLTTKDTLYPRSARIAALVRCHHPREPVAAEDAALTPFPKPAAMRDSGGLQVYEYVAILILPCRRQCLAAACPSCCKIEGERLALSYFHHGLIARSSFGAPCFSQTARTARRTAGRQRRHPNEPLGFKALCCRRHSPNPASVAPWRPTSRTSQSHWAVFYLRLPIPLTPPSHASRNGRRGWPAARRRKGSPTYSSGSLVQRPQPAPDALGFGLTVVAFLIFISPVSGRESPRLRTWGPSCFHRRCAPNTVHRAILANCTRPRRRGVPFLLRSTLWFLRSVNS